MSQLIYVLYGWVQITLLSLPIPPYMLTLTITLPPPPHLTGIAFKLWQKQELKTLMSAKFTKISTNLLQKLYPIDKPFR